MDPKQKQYLTDVSQSAPKTGYSVAQLGTIAQNLGFSAPSGATNNPAAPTSPVLSNPSSPSISSPYQDTLKTFETISKTGSAFTEEDRQAEIKKQQELISGQIDAINSAQREEVQRLREQNQQTLGGLAAQAGRGGFAGTPFALNQSNTAATEGQNKEVSLVNQYLALKNAVTKEAMEAADKRLKDKQDAMTKGSEALIAYVKSERENKQRQLAAALQKLMLNKQDILNIDAAEYGKQFGLDEKDAQETLVSVVREAKQQLLDKNPQAVEYEYARDNGYKGTFNQYQNEDANRKAVIARAGAANSAGLTPYQSYQVTSSIAKDNQTRTQAAREMVRQTGIMNTAMNNLLAGGDKSIATQSIISPFNKILDPTSVVREGEYDRTAKGQSLLSQLQGKVENISAGGGGVTQKTLQEAVNLANEFLAGAQQNIVEQNQRAEQLARTYGIDPTLVGSVGAGIQTNTPNQPEVNTHSSVLRSPNGMEEVDIASLTPAELAEAKAAGWR
jgi:hypothetical protein